ncbi:hypothetical protein BOTCAL_0082g00170 [Botryotinia calthae]|uniref:Uncharacterized protein n=1 Tax=Botryotinia calthae TaxID=38488 RepID=A0A4Y8DA12_9HELO|nr:hypothetical protein BOTCAL_0082g00170 [Botryotinia calthae]
MSVNHQSGLSEFNQHSIQKKADPIPRTPAGKPTLKRLETIKKTYNPSKVKGHRARLEEMHHSVEQPHPPFPSVKPPAPSDYRKPPRPEIITISKATGKVIPPKSKRRLVNEKKNTNKITKPRLRHRIGDKQSKISPKFGNFMSAASTYDPDFTTPGLRVRVPFSPQHASREQNEKSPLSCTDNSQSVASAPLLPSTDKSKPEELEIGEPGGISNSEPPADTLPRAKILSHEALALRVKEKSFLPSFKDKTPGNLNHHQPQQHTVNPGFKKSFLTGMGGPIIVGREFDHSDEDPIERFLPAPLIGMNELADEYCMDFARGHSRHTAEEWKFYVVEKAKRLEERGYTSRG